MIESELGEGSCFTVVIPFRLDRQAKAQEKEEAAGMNAHLAKPLEEEKVVRAIYENITEKRS